MEDKKFRITCCDDCPSIDTFKPYNQIFHKCKQTGKIIKDLREIDISCPLDNYENFDDGK